MKTIQLLFICLLIICSNAYAQDIITMKDSTTIKATIEKITPTDITYRKAADTTGPETVIYRQDVESITYANGDKEMMGKGTYIVVGHGSHHKLDSAAQSIVYGRAIISIAYLQATEKCSSAGRNIYPGIGLHFEYMLTKKENISLYFPMTLSFCSLTDENDAYPGNKIHTHTFFYMYPGFKFYPTGSNRKVSYSIGPSIALGFGRKYNVYNAPDDPAPATPYAYPPTTSSPVFKTGLIINNGLNMMPTSHLYMGMELGLGLTFYSNDNINNFEIGPRGSNNAGAPIVQFNLKAGYRF
jgi:hypothetical protein